MQKSLLAFVAACSFLQINAGCQNCYSSPNAIYNTQQSLDYFANCTEITGELHIAGPDVTNLNSLNRIKKVNGSIYLTDLTNLTSLDGLDSLSSVTGAISIRYLPLLTNFNALENIEALGALSIEYCDNLTDLQGLNHLARVDQNVFIYENDQMTHLVGLEGLKYVGAELSISGNDSLSSLTALSNLDTVGTRLSIGANALTDLHGIEQVAYIGEFLQISNEPRLTSLSGLENLEHIDYAIVLAHNPVLPDLEGLKNLQSVGDLILWNNDSLRDLKGLEKLESITGRLEINTNQSLQHLSGLDQLKNISKSLEFWNNRRLNALTGLGSLDSVGGDFLLFDNDSLPNFNGLNSLTSIGGEFQLINNPMLENFAGLETLASVGKGMKVQYSSGLTDFNGLTGLGEVGDNFLIVNNPVLKNLHGLGNLSAIGGSFFIENNPQLLTLGDLSALGTVGKTDSLGRKFLIRNNPSLKTLGDLTALSRIEGDLFILYNPALMNLGNLPNLNTIVDSCYISENASLQDLSGLDGLVSSGGWFEVYHNESLTSINGLNQLQLARNIDILNNPNLQRLNGLNQLQQVESDFTIIANPRLVQLAGLEKLDSVGRLFVVAGNDSLPNLNGLENLSFVGEQLVLGGLTMTVLTDFKKLRSLPGRLGLGGPFLNLHGLDSLVFVGGDLDISNTSALTDLEGLGNLVQVGGYLTLRENENLQNLQGLHKLETVGTLVLILNQKLKNLNGLENLRAANGMSIYQNPVLENLSGLAGLGTVDGDFYITQNMALSDCVALALCERLLNQQGNGVFIQNNAPGCNSPAEVAAMCTSIPVAVEVRLDLNGNCTSDPGDTPLDKAQIRLESASQITIHPTDSAGISLIRYLDNGAFSLSLPQFPSDHWAVCQEPINMLPDTILQDTIRAGFLLTPVSLCPEIKVNLGLPPNFRGCFVKSDINVTTQNVGSAAAKGLKIALVLPPVFEVLGVLPPLAAQSGDTLYFDMGDVEPFAFDTVKLMVKTRCDTFLLGQTLCLETFSSIENACPVTTPARAEIHLSAACIGDSVLQFTIKNTGDQATQTPHQFKVFRNGDLIKTMNFTLDAKASFQENLPADGATYRMEATQLDGSTQMTFSALENCGGFSPGWITAFWLDNGLTETDFDCRQVVQAFDPNEKSAVPSGVGNSNLISANRPLQYTIDFQNTGTDTAYRVLLRDILDNNLDVNTFHPGYASHPYTWEVRGNLLEVLFFPIILPDSNVNESASHGFFSFEIGQKPNLPDGTILENTASIIFDFNPPIITNTVRHSIGEVTVNVQEPQQHQNLWQVLGNPTRDAVTFVAKEIIDGDKWFELLDVAGRPMRMVQFSGQDFEFRRNELPNGLYLFRITDAVGRVFAGKIVVTD